MRVERQVAGKPQKIENGSEHFFPETFKEVFHGDLEKGRRVPKKNKREPSGLPSTFTTVEAADIKTL